MKPEEVIKFAEGWLAGTVFTSGDVPQDLWAMVFLPFIFMDIPEGAGFLWASTVEDQLTGRAINGFPVFASCRLMHKLDVDVCKSAIKKLEAARDALKVELANGG